MENNNKTLTLTNFLLGEIAAAMNDNSYEMDWYLDVQEEKATFLGNPDITGEYEAHEKLKRQIEQDDDGRFLPIPHSPSREAWEQMKEFILSLDDQDKKTQNLLLNTIQGKGAFRRFKDAMHEIGMIDEWYEFKSREDRKEVLDWLHSEDLITEEQIEKGMQMYEESLRKKKQREMEMRNMTKGRSVRCTQIVGHANKLTEGKVYEILAEQENHPNIQLVDDNDEKQWYPKSHFELYKG